LNYMKQLTFFQIIAKRIFDQSSAFGNTVSGSCMVTLCNNFNSLSRKKLHRRKK
jgi:hypothetical protein